MENLSESLKECTKWKRRNASTIAIASPFRIPKTKEINEFQY
jgi:hypothetical protein